MQAANIAIHILVLVIVAFWGSYHTRELLTLAACFLVCGLVTAFALIVVRQKQSPATNGLVYCLILLYWAAYLSKLGLGMVLAGQYWVVPSLSTEAQLTDSFPQAFFIFTVGYISLLTGILAAYPGITGPKTVTRPQPRYFALTVAVISGLSTKILLKYYFNLDVPGQIPSYLGAPMLTGIVSLIISSGFLFFSNTILFLSLTENNYRMALAGLCLALTNALIDLRFGSKDTILYQIALTAIYLVIVGRLTTDRTSYRKLARGLSIILAGLGAVVISAYRYMNTFRNALLGGDDVGTALGTALTSEFVESRNSLMEIYNRLTGLETLAAILPLRDSLVTGKGFQFFSSDIIDNFTYELLGSETAMTRFSITYFGHLYVTDGYIGVIIGCLLLGSIFVLVQRLIDRFHVHAAMKLAFMPVIWILFVHNLLGGGNIVLSAKEIGVVVAMFFITAKLACPAPQRRKPGVVGAMPPPLPADYPTRAVETRGAAGTAHSSPPDAHRS